MGYNELTKPMVLATFCRNSHQRWPNRRLASALL